MTTREPYPEVLARFERIVRSKIREETMTALIIDSPWLPGYARVNHLDFYFDPETWLDVWRKAHEDLAGAALVPGGWIEFGMAAEPSGFGGVVQWSSEATPSLPPIPGGLDRLAESPVPDPERDGLMPVALRMYERMIPRLAAEGIAPRMAAARGPLAVAAHLMGVTEFLVGLKTDPERCDILLGKTTDLCIAWLRAQLDRMDRPLGVLVLDDVTGLMGPEDADRFAFPHLGRVFDAFPERLKLFHNDTPNGKVYPGIGRLGIDLFNLSHQVPLTRARELVGPGPVLMGNIPPLEILVRGTPRRSP